MLGHSVYLVYVNGFKIGWNIHKTVVLTIFETAVSAIYKRASTVFSNYRFIQFFFSFIYVRLLIKRITEIAYHV